MALNRTKTTMFGAAGFLIALLIIAATPIMLPVANAGTLIIKITDAPVDLKQLFLTIDSFEVRDENGNWMAIDIPIEGSRVSFDLLMLDGVTIDGANGELEGGHYDMIRMHIVEGLDFTYAIKNEEGATAFAVRVPSEKIKIPVEFDIEAGATTIVILDILPDAEWRIAIAENLEHNMNPVIKPIVIPPTTE
jgi:hypothetical protein